MCKEREKLKTCSSLCARQPYHFFGGNKLAGQSLSTYWGGLFFKTKSHADFRSLHQLVLYSCLDQGERFITERNGEGCEEKNGYVVILYLTTSVLVDRG
jgi:hypothetical protein